MKNTKFMTRIFSAQENEEDLLLDQVQNDIEVALEDGEIDTEQYSIKKLSDTEVEIHDKVNDEDTKAELTKDEIRLLDGSEDETKEFSEIKTEDEFREYAHKVMKEAHGDEYSKEVTDKVVDDLIHNNPDADFGELIGRLTSGFGQKNFAAPEFNGSDMYAVYVDFNEKPHYEKVSSQDDIDDLVDSFGILKLVNTEEEAKEYKSQLKDSDFVKKELARVKMDTIRQKRMSDINPTPNQEGADYELRQWVADHPGQAKYIAELGAKWGVDNILEGLDHDMGETKNESKLRHFSEKAQRYFSEKSKYILIVYVKPGQYKCTKKVIALDDPNKWLDEVKKVNEEFKLTGRRTAHREGNNFDTREDAIDYFNDNKSIWDLDSSTDPNSDPTSSRHFSEK